MTGSEFFQKHFGPVWFKFSPPKRKNHYYVKLTSQTQGLWHQSDASNIPVVIIDNNLKTVGSKKIPIDDVRKFSHTTDTLSFYKLFQNCEVLEDEEILDQLSVIEAKLYLLQFSE